MTTRTRCHHPVPLYLLHSSMINVKVSKSIGTKHQKETAGTKTHDPRIKGLKKNRIMDKEEGRIKRKNSDPNLYWLEGRKEGGKKS